MQNEKAKAKEINNEDNDFVEVDSHGNLHGSPLAISLFKHFAKWRPELIQDFNPTQRNPITVTTGCRPFRDLRFKKV